MICKWQDVNKPELGYVTVDVDADGTATLISASHWKGAGPYMKSIGVKYYRIFNLKTAIESRLLVAFDEPNDILKELL